ncbi:MAG: hypothetical protein F2667_14465 [Actinobacteria bacterium]|uniref:Unannotated protein n=1 Tax=freshwater metagenome TaxID=449393 RepID=A0A6J6SH09_9ZZZZ|nr:hypothetical protein [Actinomycetota bacterium]
MTTWRSTAAVLAVAMSLLVSACSGAGDREPLPPGESALPVTPSRTAQPAPTTLVVPAVMLGTTIWTPDGQLEVPLERPASFEQVSGGFVVRSHTGEVHLVTTAGSSELSGPQRTSELGLVTDPARTLVAWISPGEGGAWRVHVADHRGLRIGTWSAPNLGGGPVARLDEEALYVATDPRTVTRFPLDRSRPTRTRVAGAARLSAVVDDRLVLADAGRTRVVGRDGATVRVLAGHVVLSPDGRYAVRSASAGLRIRDLATGLDATPELPGSASHVVWLTPTTYTVEIDSTPLISPPDGRVFHVDVCRIGERRCRAVLTTVTGTNLADPGSPVRAGGPATHRT